MEDGSQSAATSVSVLSVHLDMQINAGTCVIFTDKNGRCATLMIYLEVKYIIYNIMAQRFGVVFMIILFAVSYLSNNIIFRIRLDFNLAQKTNKNTNSTIILNKIKGLLIISKLLYFILIKLKSIIKLLDDRSWYIFL